MWNQGGGNAEGGYGDQGGGYMQSQGFSSPGGEDRKKSEQRAKTIVPVTTAQINAAEQVGEKFCIDNIELHQVMMIGVVKSVNEAATRIDYFVDDMTGPPMEVKHFVDNDEGTPEEEKTAPMRENTYVRVVAHVRAFNNKKHLVAFRLLPVTDPNEITAHMLEVMEAYMTLTKMANNMGSIGEGSSAMQGGNMSSFTAQPDQGSGLTELQNQVHMIIKSCSDEQGISLSYICNKLRGIPANKIRDTAEFLSTEGHIYSTIDDEHFKSTESM